MTRPDTDRVPRPTASPAGADTAALPTGPSDEALAVMAELADGFGDLPTLAPVALRVIELADDEHVSMHQLTEVISSDPGLAARLLRLVNSAAYSPVHEVTNLNRAAVLLGLRTLKMVTLGFTVMANVAQGCVDCSTMWRRSLATGSLARRIALRFDDDLADDAFVAGLLSNIGKVALAAHPPYTEAVVELGPWIDADVERARLGFTSDELTGAILDRWGLPRLLVDAVETRHPEDPMLRPTPLGAILQVADAAATLILADTDLARATALDVVTFAAATHVGMTVADVERIVEDVGPELDDLAESFDLAAIAPVSVDEIVRAAQAHLARLSFDVAAMLSEQKQRNDQLTATNEQLAAAAATDALTGLANRRTFDAFLANQVASRIRAPRSTMIGLLMIDIDWFKDVNDTYGHAVGDEVLRVLGGRLAGACRRGELAARVGGEEFGLILPDVLPNEVEGAANRLWELIRSEPIATAAGPIAVTASVGGTWGRTYRADLEQVLYGTADDALYASKAAGRNRVTIFPLD